MIEQEEEEKEDDKYRQHMSWMNEEVEPKVKLSKAQKKKDKKKNLEDTVKKSFANDPFRILSNEEN